MTWVVGVDPGLSANGVAFYQDGQLVRLAMLSNPALVDELRELEGLALVAIENVEAHKMVYARNDQKTKRKQARVANNVGKNQAAMRLLLQSFDYYKIPYRKFAPTGANWATKNQAIFRAATGWQDSSNKDTRSAAYFGFVGLRYV